MQSHWIALSLLTMARVAMGFQFQSAASASPGIIREIGLSQADLGVLIGLYFLPGVVLALPGGALGRRFGDKRIVMLGLLLMIAGGALSSLAQGFGPLMAGRLLAGVGGVLLNVLMSKMVIDWFSGRKELSLAMAIFVNSFPIGVGIAIATLGPLSEAAGWPASLLATAALALIALIMILLCYAPHPNDKAAVAGPAFRIALNEAVLVCIAGAIWGIFNGCFAVMAGFGPSALVRAGFTPLSANFVGAIATWMLVASVLAGGILAQRRSSPLQLIALGALVWSGCLLVMTASDTLSAPAFIVAGLFMGLPVGAIMSLPAQALRPESRALGMGLFFTWLYIGHGLVPPAAGWLLDKTGYPSAPLLFAAFLTFSMLPLYGIFRWLLSLQNKAALAQQGGIS